MNARLLRTAVSLLVIVTVGGGPLAADELIGFTEPFRTVEISAGEPGVISRIEVEPGESVKPGQPLLSLDTSVLEATLAMAKQKASSAGSIEAARAELDLRSERMQQVVKLRQRGHATQHELARAQTDVDIARARLKLAFEEQALNSLDCKRIEAQISRRHITSPYAGVISELHREMGESLVVTDPRIVTLVQLDQLRARFAAHPTHAAKLKVGEKVQLSIPSEKREVEGRISRISPVIDAKSGTLEIQVVVENAKLELRSGARCMLAVEGDGTEQPVAGNRSTRTRYTGK